MKVALKLITICMVSVLLGSRMGLALDPSPEMSEYGHTTSTVREGFRGGAARWIDLRFSHLTSTDGLSQNNVYGIFQDHRGFMWFGTGEGLNRYDGQTFVVGGFPASSDEPSGSIRSRCVSVTTS